MAKPTPKGNPSPSKKTPAGPRKAPKAVNKKPAPVPPAPGTLHDPYDVILHPVVTEKTMFNMDKNNSLEFLVRITARKPEIARAVEDLFTVKVDGVTTRIGKDGKRAVVRFAEGYSAEDVGMRIGVF